MSTTMIEGRMLIGNELCQAASQDRIESTSPATGEVIGSFPRGSAADVDRAVAVAQAAFPQWAALAPQARAKPLRKFAQILREHKDELATLDAMDSGNPVTAMRNDVEKAANGLEYYAGLAGEAKGVTIPTAASFFDFTVVEPYGVAARIIPFNHPVSFATQKLAAPLAAGNTVILKPSEYTSLSAVRVSELIADVFPPGVVNVVTGYGAEVGQPIVEHPGIPRIAFIGGVETGRRIYSGAAKLMKTVTLELGGKNPMIVFPDAPVADAGKAAARGMNLAVTAGQSCGAISRLLVHESIHDRVVEHVIETLQALKIGDPLSADTTMGPLTHQAQYDKTIDYVERGRKEGATLALGGERPPNFSAGYFFSPTVFTDVTPDMTIATEEIFGPVLAVMKWSDPEEAVKIANAVDYGLAASIWTNDLSTAYSAARQVEAGYIWINTVGDKPGGAPFGGYKMSGVGRESSIEELQSYTRIKNVVTAIR